MSLTKDELAALSKLLDQALDLPEADRDRWLEQLDSRYSTLRPTLRELLTRHANIETDDFLKTLPKIVNDLAATQADSALQPDATVGEYRLLREIGHGGMSSVWLAERVDGSMKRSVALKLPFVSTHRAEFAGRFIRERDILAGLTHPNIARLYDAGVSSFGQPYLAMEYVEGVPLIEHCDASKLTVRRRLELFKQVLSAVQYAHSQLVIHRDLKPSNILVTAQHQVALLDFGIAKLTIDGEAKETELTQFGGRALTLNYASPEQICGQTLSTALDIYSLGVILYELLTGVLPYKIKRDSRGALEDAILTAEPAKPSQSVSDDLAAANRSTTVAKIAKALRTDLDTIVLKALKKSSTDRYATAQAFAEDIERYIANKPVLAQPDSTIYLAGKFLRRNKLAVGAAVSVMIALAVGLGIAVWQARIARVEARRAQAVQGFLLDIFQSNSMDQKDPQKGRHRTAQELLDIGAIQIKEKLKDYPEAQEQVMDTLAEMYFGMGLSDEAANMRRQRIDVLRALYGVRDERVADALLSYTEDIAETTNRGQLLATLQEAKEILDDHRDFTSPTRGRLLLALTRYYRYVDVAKSRDYADEAVEFFRKDGASENLGRALRFAAKTRDSLGDYEGALIWHQKVIDNVQRQSPDMGSLLVVPFSELADSQYRLLDLGGAEKSYRTALDLGRKFQGDSHIQTLQSQLNLGRFLYDTSRRQEGRTLHRMALDIARSVDTKIASGEIPEIYGFYGAILLADGLPNDAESYIAADVDDLRKNYPGSSPLATRLASQGDMFTQLGRYVVAEATLQEALDTWRKTTGSKADPATYNRYLLRLARLALATNNPMLATARINEVSLPHSAARLPLLIDDVSAKNLLAQAYLLRNDSIDAIGAADAALQSVQRSPLRIYYQILEADASLWLGESQRRMHNLSAARSNVERALQLRMANEDERSPWIAQAEIALANCLLDSGNRDQARVLAAKAKTIHTAHKELGEHFKRPLRDLQARLGSDKK